MKQFLVEILDSDGFDSSYEVEASTWLQAKLYAIDAHFTAGGYANWGDDHSACPAIIRCVVRPLTEEEQQ